MTQKSRYFLIASAAVMFVGLGGGLLAYLAYQGPSGVPSGVPAEVRYVPADASLVAYTNVRAVMNSDLRRELLPAIEMGSRNGPKMMNDFAGIDLEKQVDHVLAYVEPSNPADEASGKTPRAQKGVMFVQGAFDQARIEEFIRGKGGVIETRNGHHLSVHKGDAEEMAVGFVRPDLLAVGEANLVRRALDLPLRPTGAPGQARDLTSNTELMGLIRDASGSTAWVVGYFDAVSRGMKLPGSVSGQVPPVRLVSAKADINGGVKATIRAETVDQPAAEQLREVVRGFIALARLQGGAQPQFESALKSIELSGTDKTVQISFAISPEAVRALAPKPSQMKPDPPPQQ